MNDMLSKRETPRERILFNVANFNRSLSISRNQIVCLVRIFYSLIIVNRYFINKNNEIKYRSMFNFYCIKNLKENT